LSSPQVGQPDIRADTPWKETIPVPVGVITTFSSLGTDLGLTFVAVF